MIMAKAAVFLTAVSMLAACTQQDSQTSMPALAASAPIHAASAPGAAPARSTAAVVPAASASSRDKLLRIAMIDAHPAHAVERYLPMAEVLAKSAGRDAGDIVASSSLQKAIGLVCSGEADLLFESLLNAARAVVDCSLRPILVAAKDGPLRYESVIFVKRGSPLRKLGDLAGKKILFETAQSASAYWIPKMLIEANGLTLEPMGRASSPTSVHYEFAREELNILGRTVHGLADAGALSNLNLDEYRDAEIEVLARSNPVPRMLLLASPRLDAAGSAFEAKAAAVHEDLTAAAALRHARVSRFDALRDQDRSVLDSVVAQLREGTKP